VLTFINDILLLIQIAWTHIMSKYIAKRNLEVCIAEQKKKEKEKKNYHNATMNIWQYVLSLFS
jgi:hypothetical protein